MKQADIERFWSKVVKDGPVPDERPDLGPCWLWTAGTDRDGYGRFKVDAVSRKAHQVAYELLIGPRPSGLEPDHLCRREGCIRPDHQEYVTTVENLRRRRLVLKTHCPAGHPYDEVNTRFSKTGGRICRLCDRLRRREERAS